MPHPVSPNRQIKAGREAEAIEYGRTHVVPLLGPPSGSGSGSGSGGGGGGSSAAAADRELLEDATALLAYDDPATGPTGGAGLCVGPMLLHDTGAPPVVACMPAYYTPALISPSAPSPAPQATCCFRGTAPSLQRS